MLNTPAHSISKLTAELVDALSLANKSEPSWDGFLDCLLEKIDVQGGRLVLVEGQDSILLSEVSSPDWDLYTRCFQLDDAELYLELYIDSGNDGGLIDKVMNWLNEGLSGILNLAYQFQKAKRRQQVALQYEERLGYARYEMNDKGEVLNCNVSAEQLLNDGVMRLFRQRAQIPAAESWIKEGINDLQKNPNKLALYKTVHSASGVFHCMLFTTHENENVWLKSSPNFLFVMIPSLQSFDGQKLQETLGLSQAEASIASWFAAGLTAAEVASKTGYKTHTVYSYIKKLYSTLEINKQSQLTALVLRSIPVI